MKNETTKISIREIVARIKAQNDSMNAVITHITKPAFPAPIPKKTFKDILEERKKQAIAEAADALAIEPMAEIGEADDTPEPDTAVTVGDVSKGTQESFSLNIVLNEKQQAAAQLAFQGKSFVLTGPAGSGKTTTQRAVAQALLDAGRFGESTFKTYDANWNKLYVTAPSIAFVAYTRRAARNLQRAIHKVPELAKAFAVNVMTVHMLLEYEPETYWDPLEEKEKFRFVPKRHSGNPLTITHLIIEEASMLGANDLWPKLFDAMPPGVQIIFIGDINQLSPIFGPSILNYALTQLPIIELTETYRNQGIILDNAHRVLRGEMVTEDENYVIVRGKSASHPPENQVAYAIARLIDKMIDSTGSDGLPDYDPEDCMILTPYNVNPCGSDNMNNYIAQFLGERRKAIVHEVLAGMSKHYLAVGDRVMFNKRDGIIIDIYRNPNYTGKIPQLPGSDLTRFGARIVGAADIEEMTQAVSDSERMIATDYTNFSLEEQELERKRQASHCVVIQYEDHTEDTLEATGDFSSQIFSLGYVLTCHKAQGCEWRKVFIILHKNQSTMHYREWFYTASTRARTKVTVFAKDSILRKVISNPRIKGNKLEDKIEYFNERYRDEIASGTVQCVKV